MSPREVNSIACLLPSTLSPVKAVEDALAILRKAKSDMSGSGFLPRDLIYQRAKQAASLPGNLSVSERFDRLDDIWKEASECITDARRRSPDLPAESSPEHKAEMAKLNAADFTDGMETRQLLKLLLPKKKTHADRLKTYRHFIAETVNFVFNPYLRKSYTANDIDSIDVKETVQGTPRAILSKAATFFLWLPGYEKSVRTERARKGANARHRKHS